MDKDEVVDKTDKILQPHHVQQKLCETRLPYRQGRKLTAVKVYSIANESNHLLIFGVPSLNLRRETRAQFMKYGTLLLFSISKDHAAEPFTETYHVCYEKIRSARIAKRMMDTKNFYGGSLHICYAPEFESIVETEQKLLQRQTDILNRLKNLKKEEDRAKDDSTKNVSNALNINEDKSNKNLLNMGVVNIISAGNEVKKNKRKIDKEKVIEKRFKPCFINKDTTVEDSDSANKKLVSNNEERSSTDVTEVEIVDCTSVNKTTISNINEALNYNKFGDETVLKLN